MSVLTQHAPRKIRATGGFAGGIAAIAEGKLYALQNPFALDGRVSSYPASARGYSVANSYLITQSDAAMLIDTGFGKDEPAIRAQVESLITPGLPLSLFPLRLNEFMSINNVEAFAGHFNVETCYTSNIDMNSLDRKSTRLNSSHTVISYAVFCLKKKKKKNKKK